MLKKLAMFTCCAATAFAMHTGEININNKDIEVSVKLDVGQFNDSVEPDTMLVGGKFLNADEAHSKDDPSKIDPYYELNFLLIRDIGDKGMRAGLGIKVNHTKNFSSVPLGLEFAYKLPFEELVPFYLNGSIYYAPEVLSMNDADSYLEYRLNLDIEVIEGGKITLGYRNLDTNYDLDFNYNSSMYIGFKIDF